MAKIAAGAKEIQGNLFDAAIPLYIHGGIGMGKSHLAQAIAWQIKEENKAKKVVYLSAEKFMYHFVQSVRSNQTMDFKTQFRSIDVLIIDDVQLSLKEVVSSCSFLCSAHFALGPQTWLWLAAEISPFYFASNREMFASSNQLFDDPY